MASPTFPDGRGDTTTWIEAAFIIAYTGMATSRGHVRLIESKTECRSPIPSIQWTVQASAQPVKTDHELCPVLLAILVTPHP